MRVKKRIIESNSDIKEAQDKLEAFLQLPNVSVLFDGKRFKLLGLGNHNEPILVDTDNAEYGNYLAYYNRFRNDSPASEGDDSPRENEVLLDSATRSYYDKYADARFTPSVFGYSPSSTEYRVVYFPDPSYARSILFEGDEGLPYILAKAGWFGDDAEKIFGKIRR